MHNQHNQPQRIRKRSIFRTYVILFWLIVRQLGTLCVSLGCSLWMWQWTVAYKLMTLQYVVAVTRYMRSLVSPESVCRRAVVVFTRVPTVGRTKSRLIPYIGHTNAALVLRVLTENVVRNLYPLGSSKEADLYLAYKDGCHVICERSVCNKPLQFWMEKIGNHLPFMVQKPFKEEHVGSNVSLHSHASTNGNGMKVESNGNSREFKRHFSTADAYVGDRLTIESALDEDKFGVYLPQLRANMEYETRSLSNILIPEGKYKCRFTSCKQPDKIVQPLPQSGNSIGATIESVLWSLFSSRYDKVVLVSSDVPAIRDYHVQQAYNALSSSADLVLGKTHSGGFYLLGANIKLRRHINQLFRNILWGTKSVYDCQMSNAERLGIPAACLREVLSDCDSVEDLCLLETQLGIPSGLLLRETISVLIPARNEADNIETTLKNLLFNFSRRRKLQVIVVDGRSTDATADVVEEFINRRAYSYLSKADLRDVTMELKTLPDNLHYGRGNMLRYGMSLVTGSYYLILHADSSPPENWDDIMIQGLSKPGVVAGAYTFHLKIPNELCFAKDVPWAIRTMLLEFSTNLRCRHYEFPSGSQGLFMHAYYYHLIGGYKDWPFLEDVEFVERVLTHGHITIADGAVMTSPRRWMTHGFLSVCGMNAAILLAYKLGVDPDKLGRLYYSIGKSYCIK